MNFNQGTFAEYTQWHDTALDAAGWTADEKTNGKLDSFNYNKSTGIWDIPNTTVKTIALFGYTQNPDLSDDYVFEKQTDSLTVLSQTQYDDLMATWSPDV